MSTQLGIITNYENDNLSLDPIQDPRIIKLKNYLGLASNKGLETNVEEIIKDIPAISDNTQNGEEARNSFLQTNFKANFGEFDKLEGKESLPTPFTTSFNVKKLIIIYLEATQTGNNWNTTEGGDNRIYLFDKDGKELKKKEGDKKTVGTATVNFFKIKIDNNVLSITTQDGEVFEFTTKDISEMTLAKLISSLLGSKIEYKGQGTDNTGPYKPELKTLGPVRVAESSNTAATTANLPPTPPSSAASDDNDDGDVDDDERVSFQGGKGKKSRKKQRNGGKKSRKQSKGGKKSRKQRKSLRKNKRSRSKK